MKKIYITLILLFCMNNIYAQAGEWTWIKGDSVKQQLGSYGVQGVSSPTNNPPALYEPCEWTDLNGNFWMFGGWGNSATQRFNDLWKYNPVTNEWTWMKGPGIPNLPGSYGTQGVPSITNFPPPKIYGAASWVDNQGNLWLFGAQGTYSGAAGAFPYSDLWKYNISTNEWTWMKGPNTPSQKGIYGIQGVPSPTNNPGARMECPTAWTDNSGDLWLFGGWGFGRHNDLWRYNIQSNEWTWMKGDSVTLPGNYGVKGVENYTNDPGGRWAHCRWKDNNGNLWLFGGVSYTGGPIHNDLWRFNIATNNWTWMSGDSTTDSPNVYGTKCMSSPSNMPGARLENRAGWTDQMGNLIFFGGFGFGANGTRNDLWKYCIGTNQWIWISGDSIKDPPGHWGTLGVSSPLNIPNMRGGSVGWKDSNNHLYIFGGSGPFNDLWKFTIDTSCGVCPPASSIIEHNPQNEITVIPNPFTNTLTVTNNNNQPATITIYDITSRKLLQQQFTNTVTLNTAQLARGIYIYSVSDKSGVIKNGKVIKE